MIAAIYPRRGPVGAAIREGLALLMDVILHIGAHRTATTSFQAYLRSQSDELARWGVCVLEPRRTRSGLFAGIAPAPGPGYVRKPARRARGRIALELARAAEAGTETLVISDENMLGSVRDNIRRGRLYAAAGERLARYAEAFDGHVTRVVLSIRNLDHFWASSIAYGVGRGHAIPSPDKLGQIAAGRRSWRDVITDLSCALPGTEIRVLPFEEFAGRPDALLRSGADCYAPTEHRSDWLNRAPDSETLRAILAERGVPRDAIPGGTPARWQPFAADQAAALRELYADDLHWLAAGADGLAQLTEETGRTRTGKTPHPDGRKTTTKRGRRNAIQERPVA